MASKSPATVSKYLEQLPEARRAVVARVRRPILDHLPRGYREAVRWGTLTYEIPLERYPETYNGQPLGYVALAAQKSHYALYLTGTYGTRPGRPACARPSPRPGRRSTMAGGARGKSGRARPRKARK
jgi:hypothetical protein